MESRECGQGRGREGCITRRLGGGARATICSCKGDKCNMGTGGGEVEEASGLSDLVWAIVGVGSGSGL